MLAFFHRPIRKTGWRLAGTLATAAAVALEAAGQQHSTTINTAPIIQIGSGHARVGGIHVGGDDGIRGSGKEATEARQVGVFTALDLNVAAQVEINVGRPLRLTLTGDDNILPLILTEVRDRTLSVRTKASYASQRELVVVVDTPSLASVRMEGAGNLAIQGLRGSRFSLNMSGACDTVAAGSVEELDVTVEGSGNADLKALASSSARIKVNGAASCAVRARKDVEAIVTGVGEIRLYGHPAKIRKTISGVGEIILVDGDEPKPDAAAPQAPATSNMTVPPGQSAIVDGNSATYAGTVISQSSNQASVISATGKWEGTVKKNGEGSAEYFTKDGEVRAILRPTGKQTIGVFSPTGGLNAILQERTVSGAGGTTNAPPQTGTSPKVNDDRTR